MSRIKTIFFGTSEFGLPAVEWLKENTDLQAVVTTPDKPVGRKQELLGSPVKQWALSQNLPILQPDKLKSDLEFRQHVKNLDLDVAIVASYGKIMPKEILQIPAHGSLNLHVSLLPKYRGAAPMQAALLAGEKVTGVSLFVIEEKLDYGPVIAEEKIVVSPEETFVSLHEKSSLLAVKLLEDNLNKYVEGLIEPQEQNHQKATYAHMLTKEDGRIDWSRPAVEIDRQVRALNPWPGTWTLQRGEEAGSQESRVKILKTTLTDKKQLAPGQLAIEGKQLFVGTGSVDVEIVELQPAGKKRMKAGDFAAGTRASLLQFS